MSWINYDLTFCHHYSCILRNKCWRAFAQTTKDFPNAYSSSVFDGGKDCRFFIDIKEYGYGKKATKHTSVESSGNGKAVVVKKPRASRRTKKG